MIVDNNLHLAGENIQHGAASSHAPATCSRPNFPLWATPPMTPRATTLAPPRRTIIAKISKHHHLQSDLVLAHIISPPSLILSSAFQHQDHRQNETHPSCRARACSHPDQVCLACCPLGEEQRQRQRGRALFCCVFCASPSSLLLPTLPIREARANSRISSAHQIQPRW